MLILCTSRTGRAYPDVSAQASNYQVVIGGRVAPVAGTSASAPVSLHLWPTRSILFAYISHKRR